LPAPIRQRFHVLNADGTPRARQTIAFQTYLTTANHCGVHQGFDGDENEVVSDSRGVAAFTAPLARLFVSNLAFEARSTPRGLRLVPTGGIVVDAGPEHPLRYAWEAPRKREFRIRVVNAAGQPLAAQMFEYEESQQCMAGPSIVEFQVGDDALVASFAAEARGDVCFGEYSGDVPTDCLDDGQLAELFRTGRLTVVRR